MSELENIEHRTSNAEHPINGRGTTRFVAIQARKGCRRAGAGSGPGVRPVSFWLAQTLALAGTHGPEAHATMLPETGMRPNDRWTPLSMLDVAFFASGGFA
jgi:hypothetical protein